MLTMWWHVYIWFVTLSRSVTRRVSHISHCCFFSCCLFSLLSTNCTYISIGLAHTDNLDVSRLTSWCLLLCKTRDLLTSTDKHLIEPSWAYCQTRPWRSWTRSWAYCRPRPGLMACSLVIVTSCSLQQG